MTFLFSLMMLVSKEQWTPIIDYPGWEGFGVICPVCKDIVPTKWRHSSNLAFEIDAKDIEKYAANPIFIEKHTDPYGFTDWLNGIRAQYGLSSVQYDENLSAWAQINNQHQSTKGLGHYVMGPARRQNAAMATYPNDMWLNSPGHRAALLDPTIRWIGIASWGMWWTFSAN